MAQDPFADVFDWDQDYSEAHYASLHDNLQSRRRSIAERKCPNWLPDKVVTNATRTWGSPRDGDYLPTKPLEYESNYTQRILKGPYFENKIRKCPIHRLQRCQECKRSNVYTWEYSAVCFACWRANYCARFDVCVNRSPFYEKKSGFIWVEDIQRDTRTNQVLTDSKGNTVKHNYRVEWYIRKQDFHLRSWILERSESEFQSVYEAWEVFTDKWRLNRPAVEAVFSSAEGRQRYTRGWKAIKQQYGLYDLLFAPIEVADD